MTYQATIRFEEATDIGRSQYLIFHLNATGPETAYQTSRQRWKQLKRQFPQAVSPQLLQVSKVEIRCPRCGASELSFCKH
jgi:hypothetical protein